MVQDGVAPTLKGKIEGRLTEQAIEEDVEYDSGNPSAVAHGSSLKILCVLKKAPMRLRIRFACSPLWSTNTVKREPFSPSGNFIYSIDLTSRDISMKLYSIRIHTTSNH